MYFLLIPIKKAEMIVYLADLQKEILAQKL